MTRPGIEPTTSRSRGGRLNPKATVAVSQSGGMACYNTMVVEWPFREHGVERIHTALVDTLLFCNLKCALR